MPRAKKPTNLTPEEEARAIDALLQEKVHRLQNQQGPWANKRRATLNAEVGRLRARRALLGRIVQDKQHLLQQRQPFVSARALYLVDQAQQQHGATATARTRYHTCALRGGGGTARCVECQRLVHAGDGGFAAIALPDGVLQRPQTRQETARVLCGDPVHRRGDGLLTRDDLCAPGPDPSVAARGDVHARRVDLRAAPAAPTGYADGWQRIGDLFSAIDDDLACLTHVLAHKCDQRTSLRVFSELHEYDNNNNNGPDVQPMDAGRARTPPQDTGVAREQGSPVLVAPGGF